MFNNKVWYVTGASQGFGLSLVKQLLAAGYGVAATSRSATGLQKAVGAVDADQFLALEVDLTSAEAIRISIEQTVAYFGRIDVIVNNAGYGMDGTVEELEEDKMRAIFEINVFATRMASRKVIPRKRRRCSSNWRKMQHRPCISGWAPMLTKGQ